MVRDLASLLSSELKLDAPVAVDVRCREDRLEQRLGPAGVELLDDLEERAHAGGKRADRLLALALLREPRAELRLATRQPSALLAPGLVDPAELLLVQEIALEQVEVLVEVGLDLAMVNPRPELAPRCRSTAAACVV